jgi:hypothetical protein
VLEHGPTYYEPGQPVLKRGVYAACTQARRVLDEVVVLGPLFPPSRTIAGPGVSVRYVLIEPCTYLRIAS